MSSGIPFTDPTLGASRKSIPVIQLPLTGPPVLWMSFCLPLKFHMKYLKYMNPSWYRNIKLRF